MVKLSAYNHFQPFGQGAHLAYNAYSGSVALMTEENYATWMRIVDKLNASAEPDFDDDEKALLTQLEFGGYVCPAEFDERAHLKFRHHMDRYDTSSLGLVIAPTLECNMACGYCYEGNKHGRMNTDVCEAIVDFADRQAPRLTSLSAGWFGGEPLLALDIIDELSRSFMDIASRHSLAYTGAMITNGYLLTEKVAGRLASLKVKNVQVTIDGPARIHNAKRPLKGGRSSFERILDNIAAASAHTDIAIRVNVDRQFTEELFEELLDELSEAGMRDRVSLGFGHIAPYTDACANIADSCYGTPEFSRAEARFYRLMFTRGFRIAKVPEPSSKFCMAQAVNSFLVDPRGELYRCSHHVGNVEHSIGNIRDGIDYGHVNFQRLFSFDPFDDSTCRECDILPLCMGGCPSMRIDRTMSTEDVCRGWKYNLSSMLEVIALYKQQQMGKNRTEAESVGTGTDDA